MLAADKWPSVMDFGLAKRVGDASATREGSVAGTPVFAPKMLGRKAQGIALGSGASGCRSGEPVAHGSIAR